MYRFLMPQFQEHYRSLVDLNRAGIPLMEIVFEPDLSNGEEAAALSTRIDACSHPARNMQLQNGSFSRNCCDLFAKTCATLLLCFASLHFTYSHIISIYHTITMRFLGMIRSNSILFLFELAEGSLRVDANVSVHKPTLHWAPEVKIKNIGSIRAVAKAIDFEIDRQISMLESGRRLLMKPGPGMLRPTLLCQCETKK
ncbi:hypothetical protein LSTR_LSTR015478 [Laodelphax striatellus]|uniref:Aspartyl/Glutamyl-tRNA(Gln) amidotransferase subunit B/E catalytic domain-containing protein n=1 Tax=Laodelphax striatellus TaxID=195883 RepID=A0A482WFH2_LAOST|nr:hypothetical protein LSTR_LSTR015478 [Laodelphax striatellus]